MCTVPWDGYYLQKSFGFELWLNADILKGIINPTNIPVDANQFLSLSQNFFPEAILSPGYTTFYNNDMKNSPDAKYNEYLMQEMVKTLGNNKCLGKKITFPLRAVFASKNWLFLYREVDF